MPPQPLIIVAALTSGRGPLLGASSLRVVVEGDDLECRSHGADATDADELSPFALDRVDGRDAGADRIPPPFGEGDDPRPPVSRVGPSFEVPEAFQAVDELLIDCCVMPACAAISPTRAPSGGMAPNTWLCAGLRSAYPFARNCSIRAASSLLYASSSNSARL